MHEDIQLDSGEILKKYIPMRRVPVLFLAGDGWPQWLQGGLANWQQTWHMATTVVAFYNNLNCWSSRCSSARRAPSWPGCCQTRWPACSWPSWPSALQGKDDLKTEILEYTRVVRCTGLLYSWPTLFSPFPIHWRIAYTGHYGFLWATFLCYIHNRVAMAH